jgi:hypothetical protein
MSWTIENALEDKNITHAARLHSEYRIRVGDLQPEVKIRIWKLLKGNGFYFTQSHYIKTPIQGTPHITSSRHADEEAYALHLALQTLVPHYDGAIAKGHTANDSWLIPNDSFIAG